jgi:exopolyphosphatase/guanosine-5'-triphosphate,3'-diphosphate pyrophosphatase
MGAVPRYAAVDVGSNSIRLLVAEVNDRRTKTLVSDRQVVRLGSGVFRDGRLSESSAELAYRVLQRMAGEFREWNVDAVRAVGTSALRDAADQKRFIARAGEILGTPLEVISGLEEARLVQMGVTSRWPHPDKRILIVDVGGGSAQLITSDGGRFVQAFSKPLGAVRLTETFLKSDPPDSRELSKLQKHIREQITEPLEELCRPEPYRMVATSSSASALVCAANDIKRSRRDEADGLAATTKQVRDLFRKLTERDTADRGEITGIGPRRAEIIIAGVAVLGEVLERTGLPRLHYSNAGVRDGIIAELAARGERKADRLLVSVRR